MPAAPLGRVMEDGTLRSLEASRRNVVKRLGVSILLSHNKISASLNLVLRSKKYTFKVITG